MKKIIILMSIITTLNGLNTYSQTISNTTWTVYDTNNKFFVYIHFNTDTVFYSDDNISYNNISTFQEIGNNFTIIDLPCGSCPGVAGRYTFLIQNDTLKFTLSRDSCSSRPVAFTTYHWINLQTVIQNLNLYPEMILYPNPASDKIFFKLKNNEQGSAYIISDHLGRQVLSGKLISEITCVDIKHLPEGLYILRIDEKNKQTIKLIKK